ncbi:MAG: hypothetical protein CMN68_08690 [Sphingomonadaceae bacterium]|nr:hypothetical protein [Sphingomonadaceae bacterium]HBK13999.1 hypothetical protein [Erythrobacter sp.]HBR83261.1 hypothetical protein [Erythrobacter sp.]
MDLNELLHAHQVSVMQASAAGDDRGGDDHFTKVAEYAERIRQLRALRQDHEAPMRLAEPDTIIYGTYAGAAGQPAAAAAVNSWEGEGGALDPPEGIAPAAVRTTLLRQYHVGAYVYQDLDLAVAEHMRQLSHTGAADECRTA